MNPILRTSVVLAMSLAPLGALAATVTTSVWTQLATTVTQPEVINLGGAVHVVTQITTPVMSAVFQLIPPNPIVPPNPIKVQVFMSADASGNVSAPAAQPQRLVNWWQAEGDATDALGVNNATDHGATFVPGRGGQAFSFVVFDFTPYVEAPSSPSLQPASVTVMAWVFVESPDAIPSIRDGNWHLAAGTYDGANARLYVDGAEVGGGTPTSLVINYTSLDHTNYDIGAYRGSCNPGFTGAIDEVRLFNRALAPAEIQSLYLTTP